MNALGLTVAAAAAPAPLDLLSAEGFAIVAAEGRLSATPRDRLRLQVLGASQLPSFLPFALREPVDPAVARTLLRDRGAVAAERLAALAGRAQVTVHAKPGEPADPVPPPVELGAVWLRGRASREARRAEAAAQLRAVLEELGDVRLRRRGDSLQGDALAASGIEVAALSRLAGRLGACPSLAHWQVSVTGPWPVFAFCDLGVTAA